MALYGLWWQFREYLEYQRILSFSEKFPFCHEFILILKSKWRDLNSKLGGCRIYVSEIYFSIFLKNKKTKTEVTLSLILRFNLRLGGNSIWSASTSRTIYDQDFGAWAPHNLEANGSTWRTTRRIWRKNQNQPERCSDYLKCSKTVGIWGSKIKFFYRINQDYCSYRSRDYH